MKCQIPGDRIRVFAKAIHALAKIKGSEYIFIQADSQQLKLQCVNDSNSAYLEFSFSNNFFHEYQCLEPVGVKIWTKCLFMIFRKITLDKWVKNCSVTMAQTKDKIEFFLDCKRSVTRQYKLPYMETQNLKFKDTTENLPVTFKVYSKTLNQAFHYFPLNCCDITMWTLADRIVFKNYLDEEMLQDPLQRFSTKFQYQPNEFEEYNIDEDITVTFDMNDVKALLSFTMHKNLVIFAKFERASKPISFSASDNSKTYSCRLLLATFDIPYEMLPPVFSQNDNSANNSLSFLGDESLSNNLPHSRPSQSQLEIQMEIDDPEEEHLENENAQINDLLSQVGDDDDANFGTPVGINLNTQAKDHYLYYESESEQSSPPRILAPDSDNEDI